jgi:hypothetical protein
MKDLAGGAAAPAHEEVLIMDMDRAMKNPGSTFGTPEALEASAELTTEQKRAILLQWKDQLLQLQAADDENMPGPETTGGATADCLTRVTTLLSKLSH